MRSLCMYMKSRYRHFCSTSIITWNEYEQNLWSLSRKGKMSDAYIILDEMIAKDIELTHYTLSSLLVGCLRSKQEYLYERIWNDLVINKRTLPNVVSYNLVIKAASKCLHTAQVKQYSQEMKHEFIYSMTTRNWNELIASYGQLNDIQSMLHEYYNMKYNN
eukprot:514261_1